MVTLAAHDNAFRQFSLKCCIAVPVHPSDVVLLSRRIGVVKLEVFMRPTVGAARRSRYSDALCVPLDGSPTSIFRTRLALR